MNFPKRSDRAVQSPPAAWAGDDRSLLIALAAFTFVVCAAIVGVFVLSTLRAREAAIGVATRSAVNLTATFARQVSDTCEAVDGILLALAERVETDGSGPQSREAVRLAMAGIVRTIPRLAGLVIIDEHGRVVVSNTSTAPRPDLMFAREPYFQYHRDHSISVVHITGPATSESADVPVINVSRRLDHLDGSFAGIVLAQIRVDYFTQAFAGVDFGPSGTAKLIADDGMLIVRQPPAALRSLGTEPMFAGPYRYQTSGSYFRRSVFDGLERLTAFRRVDRYPLVVDVALAESDYLADWRSDALTNALVRAIILVLIVGLAAVLAVQIRRRKRAENSLAGLALLDGLTGIANRRQFDLMFSREWRRAERDGTPLALLIIDVDKFKEYNDLYGHLLGDDALIVIALTIAASVVRPGDLAARYGGEEFAAILPATDCASAARVAERIRETILDVGIPHSGVAGGVASVSIGVASMIPDGRVTQISLIAAADAALYDAKRKGRNRTSVTPSARPAISLAPGAVRT